MKTYSCPSCGAPLALKYRFSKMVVCDSCKQTSFLVNGEFQVQGDKTELADYGSKFAVNATGTIKNKAFTIFGRIRFEYEGGFWDEWLVQFNDKPDVEYWFHEDEGDIILYEKKIPEEQMPDFEQTKVGKNYQFADKKLFTTEKHKAWILGGEGELPFRALPKQKADFIDGIIYGESEVFSFEFLPEETLFYSGFLLDWKDIEVKLPENPYKRII